jgi:ectoine hydroxylase-related dioxygenase (phytanoyl-CoA dioxygenase family)
MSDHALQRTLAVRAGDAVVTDYRLLHGTHANMAAHRRDALLVSFAPAWSSLDESLRAHLISHPALPADGERVPGRLEELMPAFAGTRRDRAMNREAPAVFRAADARGLAGSGD